MLLEIVEIPFSLRNKSRIINHTFKYTNKRFSNGKYLYF